MRRESTVALDVALNSGCLEFLRIHNRSVRSYLKNEVSQTCSDTHELCALHCFYNIIQVVVDSYDTVHLVKKEKPLGSNKNINDNIIIWLKKTLDRAKKKFYSMTEEVQP